MAVMNDQSLTKNEWPKKMEEVLSKYGLAEMKMKVAQAKSSSNISIGQDKNAVPPRKNNVQRAERELRPGKGQDQVSISLPSQLPLIRHKNWQVYLERGLREE